MTFRNGLTPEEPLSTVSSSILLTKPVIDHFAPGPSSVRDASEDVNEPCFESSKYSMVRNRLDSIRDRADATSAYSPSSKRC